VPASGRRWGGGGPEKKVIEIIRSEMLLPNHDEKKGVKGTDILPNCRDRPRKSF